MTGHESFVWVVPVGEAIQGQPFKIARTLDEAERAALAKRAGIESVAALTTTGVLRAWADGVEARLHFSGDVVQTCVVTLEPVPEHVEGELVRRYLPDGGQDEDDLPRPEVEVRLDEEDPPEPLTGDSIDLAPALVEELILALDPYPRAPGAKIPENILGEDRASSPFAVLERLKPKD